MIKVLIWLASLIIFAWCYSTIFTCLMTLKQIATSKISLIIYLLITIILYLISYYFINLYFNDILICSIIAFILSFITPKNI